jgi:tetratricopeptide (TPR) repeat protein
MQCRQTTGHCNPRCRGRIDVFQYHGTDPCVRRILLSMFFDSNHDNAEPPSSRRLALALLILTLVAYLPALQCGFIWDDDDYVSHNMTLRSADGLRDIWLEPGAVPQYYPLVHTTFWVEYQLWGLRPFGYHLVNVLIHAAAALLLWRFLLLLGCPASWLVAAVFALHPVNVESVAWITERKNVLCCLLYLAALIQYWRYATEDWIDSGPYLAALLLFFGALLSKTVACSMPAVVLVLLWWRHPRRLRRNAIALLPFFALGLTMAAVTVWMEKHVVGASGAEFDLSILERCLVAGKALTFYVGKIIWPDPLIFVYPRWTFEQVLPGLVGAALTIPILMIALLAISGKIGRGVPAALFVFAGVLVPALGFIDVYPMRYSFVADHFQYLAMPAFIALIVAVAAATAEKFGLRKSALNTSRFRMLAAAALCLLLVTLTWRRCGAFDDEETLWRDTLAKNPSAWMAHNNLGLILSERGEYSTAIKHYLRAIHLKADHYNAHNNIGMALMAVDELDRAQYHFKRSLELRPGTELIRVNYANLLVRREQFGEAERIYRDIIKRNGQSIAAFNNLGNMFAQLGHLDVARQAYEKARSIDPDNGDVIFNLGNIARDQGDPDGALLRYNEVLAIDSNHAEACNNIGSINLQRGELRAALTAYDRALQLRPGFAAARYNAAGALGKLGRPREAVRQYREVIRDLPDHVDAHFNLAFELDCLGEYESALEHYLIAARLRPEFAAAYNNAGIVLLQLERFSEASDAFRAVSEFRRSPSGLTNLGDALKGEGDVEGSVAQYREALMLDSNFTVARGKLAWVLATEPTLAGKHIGEAIDLATAAVAATNEEVPELLDTLAAALANGSQFEAALKRINQALELAEDGGRTVLVAAMQSRRQLYSDRKAYRIAAPAVKNPAP